MPVFLSRTALPTGSYIFKDSFLRKVPRSRDSTAARASQKFPAVVEQFLKNNSNFMRFRRNDDGAGELQTAVVSYRKRLPGGNFCERSTLRVYLVSMIHIADEQYYKTLQKMVEPYDCVLYELVASRVSLESRNNKTPLRRLKASCRLKASRSKGFNILGCIQRLKASLFKDYNILGFIHRQVARVLSLDCQCDCLDYQGEKWYHADLDYETFKSLQLERGETFFSFAREMTPRSTKASVQPASIHVDLGPWRSKLLWVSLVVPMPLVGRLIIISVCLPKNQATACPELEALSRLDFRAAMKIFSARLMTSDFMQQTTDIEAKSVIIGERNRVALEALQIAINSGSTRIAVLYGAGHMPDLGRRLREEFDMIPSWVRWITAWSIRNRDLDSRSLPFLRTLARLSGWPLDRYQPLTLFICSSVLALDLWLWKLFFGTVVNWASWAASEISTWIM